MPGTRSQQAAVLAAGQDHVANAPPAGAGPAPMAPLHAMSPT